MPVSIQARSSRLPSAPRPINGLALRCSSISGTVNRRICSCANPYGGGFVRESQAGHLKEGGPRDYLSPEPVLTALTKHVLRTN